MKRFILATVVLAAIGTGFAQAGCTAANRGGSAGPFDSASVTIGNTTIVNTTYGSNGEAGLSARAAYLCSDGSAGFDESARGKLEIRVDGALVCSTDDDLSSDPFGFGTSIVSPEGAPCGAKIRFGGFTSMWNTEAPGVAADTDGATVSARKDVTLPEEGRYWYGGTTFTVPTGTPGYITRGVRAQSDH